ncbi:MAG: 3-oxoacyl-[acyl-carrier-protein] synthase III C-terminal domain-containing protein [Dehalococcoidia bacterium]|nr:3-oxoacyl-[acyl-carrier-protein] synthase III C-terminal domain-containing protein [Dehalococcoidia bacterium]
MAGIEAFGAYVPLYRLKREEIARAWGGASQGGERALSNYDEDSVTMAVAAAIDCLKDLNRETIDAVFVATTTSPYREKLAATIVATALDLKREVAANDFTDSLRAGSMALKAALDTVKAGSAKRVLVLVADTRMGAPRSEFEQSFGDGAAAFLISNENIAVTVDATYSHVDDILDFWRTRPEDLIKTGDDRLVSHDFVKTSEDRFVITEGFLTNVQEGVSRLLKRCAITPKDITKAVFYAPDARRHKEITPSLGFDAKTQVQDALFDKMGNTGAAFAPMLLVAALETAKPGDKLLLATYGDGCDVMLLRTTDLISKAKGKRGIQGHLASKRYISNYEKYMTHRSLVSTESQRRPPLVSSVPILWRDRKWIQSFNGSKCQHCGREFFPPQRICLYCRTKDKFDYVRLSDRKGKVFTFNLDNLALSQDAPEIFCRIHLDGDVGVYCRMTDRDPEQVKIDMPVEMTFRKFHEAGGYNNYFWKCMPVR